MVYILRSSTVIDSSTFTKYFQLSLFSLEAVTRYIKTLSLFYHEVPIH